MLRSRTGVVGETGSSARFGSLDGLRGIAALVVVVHHSALTIPALAEVYRPRTTADPPGWVQALASSPLHLLWGGKEAVQVFFVLSGFVLVLPAVRGLRWSVYYPRRIIRLYAPVWGSVLVAVLLAAAVPRVVTPGASWWIDAHALPLSPALVLPNLWMLGGNTMLNSPLWSLQWEILFSLALPAYVGLGLALRRLPALQAAVVVGACVVGAVTGLSLIYYPALFALGALLAVHHERVLRSTARLSTRQWWVVLPASLVLLDAAWWPGAHHLPGAQALSALGALGLVIAAAAWAPLARVLQRPSVAWLGGISFSLYLVHEPLVVSVALLLGPGAVVWTPAIALPAALLLATGFRRAVEQPSHRMARLVGAAAGRWAAGARHRAQRGTGTPRRPRIGRVRSASGPGSSDSSGVRASAIW